MMQVDALRLRSVADRLVEDAGNPLDRAAQLLARLEDNVAITTVFDDYATDGPYRDMAASWQAEITVLRRAVDELAAALRQSADGYDRSDARAASRLDPR